MRCMSSFDIACEMVIKNEGGLVDNKNDPGGITNKGISLRLIKSRNLLYDFNNDGEVNNLEIKDITLDQAKKVYFNEFWKNNNYFKITNQQVCNYLFDTAVNIGPANANKLIQRAVRSWNIYSFIKDDGILGDISISEINKSYTNVLPPLRSERSNYYRILVLNNPSLEVFLNGWIKRCYSM